MLHLSAERASARWLILIVTWSILAILVIAESGAMREYVAMLDASSTLPDDSLSLHRAAPADYADAYTWTRLAVAAEEGAPWQTRWTNIDNAPYGREVHWNSLLVHLIAGAGRLRRAVTGEPLPRATEGALAWFNVPVFLAVAIFFSWWIAARLGAAAGVLIAFGMVGHRWFFDGFAPNYVDHHGLLAAASFGTVLGAALMGAGWRAPDEEDQIAELLPESARDARAAAILSAVSGAFGLWISAASVVPTIAFVGIAIVVVGWFADSESSAVFDGRMVRLWGAVGCAGSLAAYLAEYAPFHFSMHLEVNHPLYAFAWLGGAELAASIVEWRVGAKRLAGWRVSIAAALVIAPAVVVLAAGPSVFAPLSPTLERTHAHIMEFLSLPAFIRTYGVSMLPRFAIGFVLTIPALWFVVRPGSSAVLRFASIVTLLSAALACWEVRWWLTASGPELALLLMIVVATTAAWRSRVRWLVVAVISGIFAEQALARVLTTRAAVENRAVTEADALQPMYRDAAVVIRRSEPSARVVLLSSPNASTAISYFGGFQSLASLYWENAAGLQAAAAIMAAATDDEARELIEKRGVTHVALVSADNFTATYLKMARPASRGDDATRTFGYRLLYGRDVPRWLKPLPFRPRFPSADTTNRALLFQVVPDQTDLELAWNSAIAEAARQSWQNAEVDFGRAIDLAPATRRPELLETAARSAYEWGNHRLAIRFMAAADSARPSVADKTNIAWILATSADDGVRDGPAALALAETLVRGRESDPAILDALGAALAANGRFADAITVARRMAALARAAGDSAGVRRAVSRLASYEGGRPWRQ